MFTCWKLSNWSKSWNGDHRNIQTTWWAHNPAKKVLILLLPFVCVEVCSVVESLLRICRFMFWETKCGEKWVGAASLVDWLPQIPGKLCWCGRTVRPSRSVLMVHLHVPGWVNPLPSAVIREDKDLNLHGNPEPGRRLSTELCLEDNGQQPQALSSDRFRATSRNGCSSCIREIRPRTQTAALFLTQIRPSSWDYCFFFLLFHRPVF
jgi:hypothetical protein